MPKLRIIITSILLIMSILAKSQCENNLLVNGELNAQIGLGITADGWMAIGDPDVHDHLSGTLYNYHRWLHPIIPSADSSNWQDMIGFERIYQKVVVEKGVVYNLNFNYATHSMQEYDSNDPEIEIYSAPLELKPVVWLNSVKSHVSPETLIGNFWYQDCFLIEAESDTLTVMFGHEEGGYIGFDNICLTKVSENRLLENVNLCIGEEAILESNNPDAKLTWSTSDTTNQITVSSSGLYWLDIEETCGTYRKEFEVSVDDCGCSLYIPDTFSPNLLGVNNAFTLGTNCTTVDFHIDIYDRWGSIVFSSDDILNSWTGRTNSSQVKQGMYFYTVRYNFLNEERNSYGAINLLR